MGRLQVVVGGQFGSEGKGAIAGFLAAEGRDELLAVRVAGPNAGHTIIGRCPPDCEARIDWPALDNDNPLIPPSRHVPDRHPWRLRQVPVAAVSSERAGLLIAAGSEIDPEVLMSELYDLDAAGYRASARLMIDGQATVIEEHHKDAEQPTGGRLQWSLVERIGSTGKGVGAARAARVMREAVTCREANMNYAVTDGARVIGSHLARAGGRVLVEGTQGYGLGTHAGHYPYCTSSDCRAIDFMSMAGISPWLVAPDDLEIWVVFRTHPIRVAGNSGPLRYETTWEALGLPQELTTVTRTGRGPVRAALTMCDHVVMGAAGHGSTRTMAAEDARQLDLLLASTEHDLDCRISLAGTGPSSVIDLRDGER